VLWHTNHAVSPETLVGAADAKAMAQYGYPGLLENSRARYENLGRLVPQMEQSRRGLERALRDHTTPGAVCQHGDADMHSSAGVIICPGLRQLWGAMGYPCLSDFVTFAL
jgi:hypothetical protein